MLHPQIEVDTLVPESRFQNYGGRQYFTNETDFKNYLKEIKNSKKTIRKKSDESRIVQNRVGGSYNDNFPSFLAADNGYEILENYQESSGQKLKN